MSADVHRSVARGLERLADDMAIADDGPHVAFVIGIDMSGIPSMWIATRDEIARPADRIAFSQKPGDGSKPTSWTMADMATASSFIHDFIEGARGQRYQATGLPVGRMHPVEYAHYRREQRQQWEIDRHLALDADLLDHPHPCDACRRRFKTARGMQMHRATCTAAISDAHRCISTSWQQPPLPPQVTMNCTCGESIIGLDTRAARRAMREHLDVAAEARS